MVINPLLRPYFLPGGGGGIVGVPLDSHDLLRVQVLSLKLGTTNYLES